MPECIIVGGGVIGLLTARALHKKGMDVLVLERGEPGGESSWAGGGIISPLYPWRYADAVNYLAQRSKQIYPLLIDELHDESGVDSELLQSGLFVQLDDDIDSVQEWGRKWSVEMIYIGDAAGVRHIEPQTGAGVNRGIWMPDIMQVRNPKLVKALKGSFDVQGIACKTQCRVKEILTEKNRVKGVCTQSETLFADTVVIASGAWTAQFVPTDMVAVEPVKGQMIMYRGQAGQLKRMVLSAGHYVIPRKDGHILVGSTLEKNSFDKTISGAALAKLQQAAVELIPMLATLPVERQWAGLRPGTENGIPYICEHDAIENLYIHAGHYRNGIVMGAASAELMAAIINREEPVINATPYAMNALH